MIRMSSRSLRFSILLTVAFYGFSAQMRLTFAGSPTEDGEFDIAKMPIELMKDANAVVRLETLTFTVEGPGKAVEHRQRVVTILNKEGRELGQLAVLYDRFRNLKSLRGTLLDAQGKKIRDLKKRDTNDYSAISGYALYEDHRVRFAELYHDSYPYTVAYEYEVAHDGLISWPTWHPQSSEEPVERAVFVLNVPAEMSVRYHYRGVFADPEITNFTDHKNYRWEATRLPTRTAEPYGPTWGQQAPSVYTAPSSFEIAGLRGDMSSWQAFGKWCWQLYDDRRSLPDAALYKINQITADASSPEEVTKAIYEHLQSTTRYVSVQLGIGGWQPFPASYVSERGYGDCKALSNYMLALLDAVSIRAYPVLVRNGIREPDVIADFPSNQFNHVIVCVPLSKDTLWLECTSQTVPFGHIGAGNEDRNVLVLTPDGGKLVRTPSSLASDNRQVRHAQVVLDSFGNGLATVVTTYTGNQQDHVRQALAQSSPRDRENWLRQQIDIPSFSLVAADFSNVESHERQISLPVTLELPRLAVGSGNRLFLRPNLMERWETVPRAVKNRTQPIELSYTYLDIDSIRYQLPAKFAVEAMPAPVTIETAFGHYSASTAFENGALMYVRRLEMRQRSMPAEQYESYRNFIADLVKADRAQVVLVRQQ